MHKKLDDIEKKVGFEVPKGYFEDLPMKVQQRIHTEKKEKVFWKTPSWSLAMAASVVLLLGFVFLLSGPTTELEDLLADVPEEALVAYLDELELDAYDLASAFPEAANELEFEDIEIMDGLEMEDISIDDVLLEYDLEEENMEI